MTVTGVTDCAILAILRHRLQCNYTSDRWIYGYIAIDPVAQAYNQSVIEPLCDLSLPLTRLFLPHRGLVLVVVLGMILQQHAPEYDKGKRRTNRGWFHGVGIGNLLLLGVL